MPHMGRRITDPDTGNEMVELQLTAKIVGDPRHEWCPTCLLPSLVTHDVSVTGPMFPETIIHHARCPECGR